MTNRTAALLLLIIGLGVAVSLSVFGKTDSPVDPPKGVTSTVQPQQAPINAGQAAESVKRQFKGRIHSVALEREPGRLVYSVTVHDSQHRLKEVFVDAYSGTILHDSESVKEVDKDAGKSSHTQIRGRK